MERDCEEVLAGSARSDCDSLVEMVDQLSSLLSGGHRLLLQAQQAVLQHGSTCRACSDGQHTLAALRLRQAVLATPLDLPASYR